MLSHPEGRVSRAEARATAAAMRRWAFGQGVLGARTQEPFWQQMWGLPSHMILKWGRVTAAHPALGLPQGSRPRGPAGTVPPPGSQQGCWGVGAHSVHLQHPSTPCTLYQAWTCLPSRAHSKAPLGWLAHPACSLIPIPLPDWGSSQYPLTSARNAPCVHETDQKSRQQTSKCRSCLGPEQQDAVSARWKVY